MLYSGISILYQLLAVLIGLYLAILFVVNRISNVTVKALGWLAVKHVTIRTKKGEVYVRKVKFTVNLFRSRDSPLKLFNLEFHDMELNVVQSIPDVQETMKTRRNDENIETDILKVLKFCVPKKVFEIIFRRRIFNKFNLHFYRFAIYNKEFDNSRYAFFDYARLESNFNAEGRGRLVATVINGYTHSTDVSAENNDTKFIRNVEFCINFNTVFSCMINSRSKLFLELKNFDISLSLGRMSLPLDCILPHARDNKKDQLQQRSKVDIIKLSESVLEVFSSLDIKFEDFSVLYQDVRVQIANLQTVASKSHDVHLNKEDLMNLLIYMTSCKVFHKEGQSLEIPSSTFEVKSDFVRVLKAILEVKKGANCFSQNSKPLEIRSALTITRPVVDIYYDQLEHLSFANNPRTRDQNRNKFDRTGFLEIINYVSNKILIVDTTVNVHLPKLGSKEFHRGSHLNIVVSCSLLSLYHKFQSHNFKKGMQRDTEKFNIDGYFKLKSLKIDVVDNLIHLSRSNLLLSYNFLENNLSIRLANKEVKLKSVNDIIFQLLRKLRDSNIKQHNKIFASEEFERRKLLPLINLGNTCQERYIELFNLLPPFISSFKFSSSNIEADIICKDGLPKHVVFDEMLQKHIDLGEFKRGIFIKLNDIEFNYKYAKKEISSSIRSTQCFTVSEFASELEDNSEFQDADSTETDTSDMSSLDSENIKDSEEEELKRVKRVLNISDISLKNNCNEKDNNGDRDKNNLFLSVNAIDGKIDIFLIWCSVYALSLINYFAPKVKRNYTKEEMEKCRGPPKKLKLDIFIDSIAVTVRLPNKVDVLLEFDTVKARNISFAKATRFNFIRLYVVHPSTRLWSRLLIIKGSVFKYNSVVLDDHDRFESISESIRLNIPHQFLFYTVIDNIITFAKSARQIRYNFDQLTSGMEEFDRIMPQEKQSTNIPRINVKAKIFGITLENDLFENELSYIFELGKIEQRERLKKLKLFDVKVEEILSNTRPGIEEKIELSNKNPVPQKFATSMGHFSSSPKANSPLRKIFSESGFCLPSRTHSFRDKFHKHKKNESWDIKEEDEEWIYANDKEANMKISQAKERLDKQFATSWIQKYKKFRNNKIRNWENKVKTGWGPERVHPRITEKFDILDYSSGPHMLCGYFKDIDLTVDKAKIGDVDDFIYKYGKKQPKLNYSILIPLFVSLKSSSLYVILRDYPLPLLSFPSNNEPKNPTINLHGNFVINEKLVKSKEEMRFIYVPFSPAATASKNECDNFYSVYIPRTLTPVKVILDMKCDLNTNKACMITWCKAYSAGLLAVLAAFDKFTKPKIDYSPIGWWDKVALLVHGKAVFNIANELCLHMKASTCPYDLVGKAAGFVFSWRNNVCLRLNDKGISKDLLKLDSDDFVLGIPNYSQSEIDSWSLFYENNNLLLGSVREPNKFSKKVIKLSSSNRVQWVFGVLFERNKECSTILSDQQPRTSVFKAHYDVRVASTSEDSYIDYRSDYIHMSLRVVSKSSGNNYNAAYFTPLTFHYFFHWWDSLTKHTSLPIRNGRLFSKEPADVSHIKMGSHIFTVKYQLIFEPISISHLYIHSSNGQLDRRNKLAFTGLKGKFSTCAIDLHQRKEQIRYVNEKLDINNKILHLKMNEGGVDIDDADIRFVNAIFNEKSVRGYLEKYMKDSNDSESTDSRPHNSQNDKFNTFSDWIENVDIFDNENLWIDADDYVELHQTVRPSQSPNIRILPFFYSPKITYFREFSLHEDGPYPFGNEKFHNCIIGLSKPENTQTVLLNERKKNVEREIETNKQLLPENLSQEEEDMQQEEIQKIRKDIRECKEKLSVIETIEEELLDLTSTPNISKPELDEDLSTETNKCSYTDRNMYNKIKDMSVINSSVSDFHNGFILHNPQLKWHNDLRDLFMEYIQKVGDRKTQVYFMGKKAIDLAESFIKSRMEEEDNNREQCDEACKNSYAEKVFRKEYKTSEELLKNFNQQINEIYSDDHEVEDKYLFKLIHPQIQLVSERDLNSCVLVTSTDVELRIVSINVKGMDDVVSENNEVSKLVESRYGVSFVDSHVFAFKRPENFVTLNDMPYGSNCNSNLTWPPWLATEVCYDSSWAKEQLVIERTSMTFLLMKPNFLVASNCRASIQNTEISLHASKLVINADSNQYSTMYYIITDLLLHTNTQRDSLLNKVDKIVSLSDYNDFNGLDIRIKELQDSMKVYIEIILKLNRNVFLLDGQQRDQLTAMEVELERMNIELFVLMNGLGVKSSKSQLSNKNTTRLLSVEADQVIWHLLNEDKMPFMDFALAKGRFIRVDSIDGANINLLEVSMIQGFNLQAEAIYPEVLKPHLGSNEYENYTSIKKMDKPVLQVTWRMLNHIGGIPIIQEAKIDVQPLKVQLDYISTKKLYAYLFPGGNNETEVNDDILEDEIKDFEATKKQKVNPFKKFMNREKNNLSDSVISRELDAADSTEEVSSSILSAEDLFRTDTQNTSRSSFSIEKSSNYKGTKEADDIAIIMNRSSKYVSIIKIEIAKVNMSISFSAPKHLSILNVHNLAMTIPTLKYKHKMWSAEEFVLRLRKDIIKIILNHTGKIIGNKFKPANRKHRMEPLQQISNYASYITLQDLQLKQEDQFEDLKLDISSQRLSKADSIGH